MILPGVAIPEEEQLRGLNVDGTEGYDSAAVDPLRADVRRVTEILPNISPEDFSAVSRDVDRAELVEAVYAAVDHVTAENVDPEREGIQGGRCLTAYLKGGVRSQADWLADGLSPFLLFTAGEQENLVQITYSNAPYANTCLVECESLYRLVRRAGDPPAGGADAETAPAYPAEGRLPAA